MFHILRNRLKKDKCKKKKIIKKKWGKNPLYVNSTH